MKFVARLFVTLMIPLTILACSQDNKGEANMIAGNEAGSAAFNAKEALKNQHLVYIDQPSKSWDIIRQMPLGEAIQVKKDLQEFRRLTQSFLAYGRTPDSGISFVGNSERIAELQLLTAQQLITWVDQRISSFEHPRPNPRDRDDRRGRQPRPRN